MTAVSEAEADDCYVEAFKLRHMALRNAKYHSARKGWLDSWNRFYNLVVILGGTASAAKFFASSTPAAALANNASSTTHGFNTEVTVGFMIAAVGALQLVYDFAGRARTHEFLQRRFYEILGEIDACIDPTYAQCAKWRSEVTLVGADAPPTLRALDAIMDNQATAALRGARQPRLLVTWYQRRLRHLWPFLSATFPETTGWEVEELGPETTPNVAKVSQGV